MDILEFVQKYLIFLLPGIIGVLLYNKINISPNNCFGFNKLLYIITL